MLALVLTILLSMEPAGGTVRYNCVCSRHNFGLPHLVSSTTWYRHLSEAGSDEERARMNAAKLDINAISGGSGNPVRPRRYRGLALRRHNNVPPVRKTVREASTPEVCIIFTIT